MTMIRAAEVGGAAVVATATAAAAVVETGVPSWVGWLVTIGAGIVAGYFSARITSEKAVSSLEARMDGVQASVEGLRSEMKEYYQRKGPRS